MSKTTLKSRTARLSEELAARGFIADGPFRMKRTYAYLEQYIQVQPGHDWLEGRFTANLCWKLTADGIAAPDVYDYVIGIGFLVGDADLWLSCETREALDASFHQLRTLLQEHGVPFLDSVTDLGRMVELYEAAISKPAQTEATASSPSLFFGIDEGWRHYNLGFAYKVLGNTAKANEHLSTVVREHGELPFDWAQDRRRACERALATL